MENRQHTIPYGKSTLVFTLPAGIAVELATSKPIPPVKDKIAAVKAALAAPIGSPLLREIARPGDKVCIVFTDITRSTPDEILVPALIEELKTAGVQDGNITLLCGIGMHRPSTPKEKQHHPGRRDRRQVPGDRQ